MLAKTLFFIHVICMYNHILFLFILPFLRTKKKIEEPTNNYNSTGKR